MNRGISVDLQGDGLLWLINSAALHPRGFALALDTRSGQLLLLGDGSEPWHFLDTSGTNAKFEAVEALFARAKGEQG